MVQTSETAVTNSAPTEPETVLPAGASTSAALTKEGDAVITLHLLAEPDAEGEAPQATHNVTMYAALAYQVGQLLMEGAVTAEQRAQEFRTKNARRMANEPRQAQSSSGLILPTRLLKGDDNGQHQA